MTNFSEVTPSHRINLRREPISRSSQRLPAWRCTGGQKGISGVGLARAERPIDLGG
jgi:hypothetical protein